MSQYKWTNKNTGITYVYEATYSYDKEKKRSVSKKKMVGKIDPETGEIVPTGKRGRGPKTRDELIITKHTEAEYEDLRAKLERTLNDLHEKDRTIIELNSEIRALKKTIKEHNKLVRDTLSSLIASPEFNSEDN